MEMIMGSLWTLVTILGPILLGGVLIWAISRNRKQSPREVARTEAGTRELYRQEDAEAHRDHAVDHTPVDR
jgi:hypothetical protein